MGRAFGPDAVAHASGLGRAFGPDAVAHAVQIVHYFQLLPRHGSFWLLFDGIVSLILAVTIWRSWPFSSVWAVGTLVGISLLFTGFSRLMLTLTARRALTA